MRQPLAALLGLLALIGVSGCGVSTRGAERAVLTVRGPATTSSAGAERLAHRAPGALIIDGSTAGSLTALAASAYRAAGGNDSVGIKNNGAAAAFAALCRGRIDMVDSSRLISSSELAQCERAGIRPVQLVVASNAIVLATKTGTDVGADCLTVAEVKSITRAGSPVYNWGQLGFDQLPLSVAGPAPPSNAFGFFDRYVLGSGQQSLLDFRFDYHAESADQAIREFVTGTTSDAAEASGLTHLQQRARTLSAILTGANKTLTDANASVKEASFQVTKGIADKRTAAAQQQDATNLAAAKAQQKKAQSAVSGQNSELAATRRPILADRAAGRRLRADLGHLGLFGFSYYERFDDSLRPLEITASASPENCIFPSQQTVTTAAYPLSRQLLITTSVQDVQRTDVRDFLLSYLHNSQRLANQQGLVALPDNVLGREQAFFGASEQQSAGVSSAANASSTGGSPAADLPTPVH